jgi:VanZ family protein
MPLHRRIPRDRLLVFALLAVYAVALALVAFWPHHVDRDAGPLLDAITRLLPWATYEVVEFVSNIVQFLPLGALLAVVLRRRPWVAVAAGLGASIVIETVQGLLLPGRTASALDVFANTLGTALGVGAVWGVLALLAHRRARRTPPAPPPALRPWTDRET